MLALRHRLVRILSAASVAFSPMASRANPLGGQVAGGAATISGTGTTTVIVNQSSPRSIINWQSFNLAPGETTQFIQPDASSVTLNRVTGGLGASQINGAIKANGDVYVVNPDGILFGPQATVNVGSFLGTTHDIADRDFMTGKNNFTISGNPSASIVNQGSITAAQGGFAALVAPGVRNDGIITANLGTVALASGNGFTLDLYGDNLIKLQPGDSVAGTVRDVATGQTLKSLVQNSGKLKAKGGTVALTAVAARKVLASVINTSGVIEADSVGTHNGMVVFGAATADIKPTGAPRQTVRVSGTIRTAGKRAATTGGKIQITGETIKLAHAKLDASGKAGGGTILIGGDFKGGDPTAPAVIQYGQNFETTAVPTATTVTVDTASTLDTSARTSGNGGKVVVWANDTTTFAGSILAMGGKTGGNGGFAEVSGKNTVNYGGIRAHLTARSGTAGTVLFDPQTDTIDAAKAQSFMDLLNQGESAADSSDIIDLNSSIFKTSGGDATLTLTAKQTINVADNITIGSSAGKLNVFLQAGVIAPADYQNAVLNEFSAIYASGLTPTDVFFDNIPVGQTFTSYFSQYFSDEYRNSVIYYLFNNALDPTKVFHPGDNFQIFSNGGTFTLNPDISLKVGASGQRI